MTTIKHNWNGYAITQLTENTEIAQYEIPAGYVNATQMCKACGRNFNDYSKTDSTKAYWKALSTETNILVSELVITIKGGNNKQSQGTWVHPEIAIDLAQWVSVEFRIWANSTLRKLITGETSPQSRPEIEQSYDLLSKIFGGLNISPEVQKIHVLDCLRKQYDLPMLTEASKALEQYTAVKQRYIRVTDLAYIWNQQNNSNKKPTEINLALQDAGLQKRIFAKRTNSKGKLVSDNRWELTEKGLEYGSYVAKAAGGLGTKQSIQWFQSVLSVIGEFLDE